MIGNVDQNFKDFVRDVKIYFTATETDKKSKAVQVARLKNLMGCDALSQYEARSTLKEEDETVEEVIKLLTEIFVPKKNEIWEVYQFFDRKQQTGETFNSFYSDLRKLVRSCKFEAQEDKLMKVQIVLGVSSKNVQQRLLREDMSVDKMVDYCKSVELAEKKSKAMCLSVPVNPVFCQSEAVRAEDDEVQVNAVYDKQRYHGQNRYGSLSQIPQPSSRITQQSYQACQQCGRYHGNGVVCMARGRMCNVCGENGHFARMCNKNLMMTKRVCNILESDYVRCSDDEFGYVLNLDSVTESRVHTNEICGGKKQKAWMKQVSVNEYPIEFKLDTGSEANILPAKYLSYLKPRPQLKKSNIKLEAYGGHFIYPKGEASLLLETKDRILEAEFVIVDLNTVPILELETCVDLGLIKKVHILMTGNDEKSKFINTNSDVFTGIGCFPEECSLKLKVREPLVSHKIPEIPFYKVGVDIAQWAGKYYLVLIDYFSRWIEIRKMSNKSSSEVIDCLKRIFSVHGIPAEVFCDNNPFSGCELYKFAKEWNFKIHTVSP